MKALLALLLLAPPLRAAEPYGILLLAHGGDSSWNEEVAKLRGRVDAKVPTELALGMADVKALQDAVNRLEKRGVARIVGVPLFVQSRSEVLDQTRYALKLSDKPSASLKEAYARMAKAHGHHAKGGHGAHGGHSMTFSLERVKSREPLVMSRALDDHELVGRILAERANTLAGRADKAHLVLVAHGPVDDSAVKVWKDSLMSLCAMAGGKSGKFLDCASALLRDDAAPDVRAAAVKDFREKVARTEHGKFGPVVVVPVLIARGGIERKIPKDLAGLDYEWDGKTLMPHEGFDGWVLESAAKADWAGRQ